MHNRPLLKYQFQNSPKRLYGEFRLWNSMKSVVCFTAATDACANVITTVIYFGFFFLLCCISIINKRNHCKSKYFPSGIRFGSHHILFLQWFLWLNRWRLAWLQLMPCRERSMKQELLQIFFVSEIPLCLFLLGDNSNWCSHVKEDWWLPPM